MRRARNFVLSLLFAVVLQGVVGSFAGPTVALADCPAGTNWDAVTQTCH